MNAPVLDVGGLSLRAPASVVTNLMLAGQALWLTRRSVAGPGRAAEPPRRSGWHLFLRLMVVAAAAGAVKHGTDPGWLREASRLTSNLALGLAVTLVAMAGGTRGGAGTAWRRRALWPGFGAFVLATVAWPSFLVVVAYLASVLGLVIADEVRGTFTRRPGAAAALTALAVAAVAVWSYLLPVELGPWIGGVDVAHLVLMASLPLLAAAHRAAGGAP